MQRFWSIATILAAVCLAAACSSVRSNIILNTSSPELFGDQIPRRIAILPFKSPIGHPHLGENVSDMFTTEMISVPGLSIVERSRLVNILKEQKLGLSGVVDMQTAQEVGKVLGVEGIIFGSIGEYGQKLTRGTFSVGMESTFSISLKLVMVKTGLVVWSASATGSSPKSKSELQSECISKVVADLKQKLKAKK